MHNEIWQIKVNGQIYQCAFGEIEQWIIDRALLPDDEVRSGTRGWIKANRVPALQRFFDNVSTISPDLSEVSDFTETAENFAQESEFINQKENDLSSKKENDLSSESFSPRTKRNVAMPEPAAVCHSHFEAPTAWVCCECNNSFCKDCPKSFGTVKICPLCGQLCRSYLEFQTKTAQNTKRAQALSAGYGFEDFKRAWQYPFRFWQSLCLGALFVAVFSLGGL